MFIDTAVVNSSCINTLLASDVNIFLGNSKPIFSNSSISSPRNPPYSEVWSKKFLQSFITLQSDIFTVTKKYLLRIIFLGIPAKDNSNSRLTPWKIKSHRKYKQRVYFCIVTFDWYLFKIFACLNTDFNCCNSFSLSWVDIVDTET